MTLRYLYGTQGLPETIFMDLSTFCICACTPQSIMFCICTYVKYIMHVMWQKMFYCYIRGCCIIGNTSGNFTGNIAGNIIGNITKHVTQQEVFYRHISGCCITVTITYNIILQKVWQENVLLLNWWVLHYWWQNGITILHVMLQKVFFCHTSSGS